MPTANANRVETECSTPPLSVGLTDSTDPMIARILATWPPTDDCSPLPRTFTWGGEPTCI